MTLFLSRAYGFSDKYTNRHENLIVNQCQVKIINYSLFLKRKEGIAL